MYQKPNDIPRHSYASPQAVAEISGMGGALFGAIGADTICAPDQAMSIVKLGLGRCYNVVISIAIVAMITAGLLPRSGYKAKWWKYRIYQDGAIRNAVQNQAQNAVLSGQEIAG